uniref:Uncharacterized protein n=1 Tax=Anguilla anguilla TaxID=7936 RepID=A0A0E9TQ43_ANGAN
MSQTQRPTWCFL